MTALAFDRARFFSSIRAAVFHGHLSQKQVDGVNLILATWTGSNLSDPRWLAYMLGTAYHETGATMQPIHEYGSAAYFTRMYDVKGRRPEVARRMGNTEPGDGVKYAGRGFVQLTWKNNYALMGKVLGIDLVRYPDMAMRPEVAAKIMFEGMTRRDVLFEDDSAITPNAGATFTGKALEDYFNDDEEDWFNARRVINGLDHAQMIADTATDFHAAMS